MIELSIDTVLTVLVILIISNILTNITLKFIFIFFKRQYYNYNKYTKKSNKAT